ncbi:hypothetical protein [Fibrella arboris]|uniref:hypothetical protein n=1 Tax=Fibrella arboris TaxID=3242486 RepID=UPI00352012E1
MAIPVDSFDMYLATKTYREQLVDIINSLCEAREIVFGQIVNFGMQNELKEIDEVFAVGDTYNFSIEHFETSNDTNLVKVFELCKKIQETVESLMNLNLIEEEDLLQDE